MTLPFTEQLRRRTWTHMAADFVAAMTETGNSANQNALGRQNVGIETSARAWASNGSSAALRAHKNWA